jgi:hypothetical protein
VKAKGFIFLIGFILISCNAHSQTTADSAMGSRQEIVDWLNKKFSLYIIQPSNLTKGKVESVNFAPCAMHVFNAFQSPDNKIENVTVNLSDIKSIDFFDMQGGTLFINYSGKIVYIGFDVEKESDLLNQIKKSIDYLKTFCTAN